MIKFVEKFDEKDEPIRIMPFIKFNDDSSFFLCFGDEGGNTVNVLGVYSDGASVLCRGLSPCAGLKLDKQGRLACYPGSEAK